MNDIQTIAVYFLPVLLAITLHEAAHAFAAKYFGDATAFLQGRMSLNPLKHIDPFGTIILPVLLYLSSKGTFLLGYAKPVPIEYGNLRNPKSDMAWVALAGPAANLVMALAWVILFIVFNIAKIDQVFFFQMAEAGIKTNLVIFAFNLFPIPPLDGGRILTSVLPNKYARQFAKVERLGFVVVLVLAISGLLWDYWVAPINQVLMHFVKFFINTFLN